MKIGKNERFTIPQTIQGRKYAEELIADLNSKGYGVTRLDDTVVIVIEVKYGYEIEGDDGR